MTDWPTLHDEMKLVYAERRDNLVAMRQNPRQFTHEECSKRAARMPILADCGRVIAAIASSPEAQAFIEPLLKGRGDDAA